MNFDPVGAGEPFDGREPQIALHADLDLLVVLVAKSAHLSELLLGQAVPFPQSAKPFNQSRLGRCWHPGRVILGR